MGNDRVSEPPETSYRPIDPEGPIAKWAPLLRYHEALFAASELPFSRITVDYHLRQTYSEKGRAEFEEVNYVTFWVGNSVASSEDQRRLDHIPQARELERDAHSYAAFIPCDIGCGDMSWERLIEIKREEIEISIFADTENSIDLTIRLRPIQGEWQVCITLDWEHDGPLTDILEGDPARFEVIPHLEDAGVNAPDDEPEKFDARLEGDYIHVDIHQAAVEHIQFG